MERAYQTLEPVAFTIEGDTQEVFLDMLPHWVVQRLFAPDADEAQDPIEAMGDLVVFGPR